MKVEKVVPDEMAMFNVGPTKKVILPDGVGVTIREMNGEDEDIFTKIKSAKDGTALHNFIANIIVEPKMTGEDVSKMKIRNKYYLLLEIRVFTHGPKVDVNYEFEDGVKTSVEVDLTDYLYDFGNPPIGKGVKLPKCKPYKDNTTSFKFTLSNGKECMMDFLTGEMELKMLVKEADDISINDSLRLRNFQLMMGAGKFMPIERFNVFSSREMKEIRKHLMENDPEFNLNVPIKHPKTGINQEVSLFGLMDFFFPQA